MELRQPLLSASAEPVAQPLVVGDGGSYGARSQTIHKSTHAAMSSPMGLLRPTDIYPLFVLAERYSCCCEGPHEFTTGRRIGTSPLGH
jgi:hypothetical protein